MKAADLPTLLDAALDLAVEAGRRILGVYQSDFAVTHKDDDSPLTQADLAAHALITETLGKVAPVLPLLSEEGADIPYAVRRAWQRYWLIDPLDGTREFVKRNGEFTVNIALIDSHRPILGVVHAPVLNLTYGAALGVGAFRVDDNNLRAAIATNRASRRMTVVASRSHRDAETDRILGRLPPHDAVSRGSSLKFCLVADGTADFYPRLGPTSEWDTAAGQCLVEQAGGAVWRLPDLAPLAYNEKESVLNPSFAVVGDPGRDWASVLVGAASAATVAAKAAPATDG